MNTMKKKLQSNSGVSILFALLLFLVVSMVSVTILSAAYSSVKRTHAVKVDTQDILALDSASLIMKKNMDNVTYTVPKQKDETLNYTRAKLSVKDNPFETELTNISTEILNNNISANEKDAFDVEATNLNTVSTKYSIQVTEVNTYIVIFALETTNESKTYVKFNVEKTENTSECKVSWSFFEISGKKN